MNRQLESMFKALESFYASYPDPIVCTCHRNMSHDEDCVCTIAYKAFLATEEGRAVMKSMREGR